MVRYLGIEVEDALELSEQTDIQLTSAKVGTQSFAMLQTEPWTVDQNRRCTVGWFSAFTIDASG